MQEGELGLKEPVNCNITYGTLSYFSLKLWAY